jgi:hypothetical protein
MKAIPMKGRLTGKRICGYLWAGPGAAWTKKENYFQLEDQKLVTAVLASGSGQFWVRCKGATCEVKLKGPTGRALGTVVLALPGGRKSR